MDRLPDELVLQIFTHLDLQSNTRVQRLSHRYWHLARDERAWRLECFQESRAGRAFQLAASDKTRTTTGNSEAGSRPSTSASGRSALGLLRDAVSTFTARTYSFGLGYGQRSELGPDERATSSYDLSYTALRSRAIANWDPGYQDERVDYYQEYIRRHAPIAPVRYLKVSKLGSTDSGVDPELLGMDVLRSYSATSTVEKVIAHADDGTVRIWDISVSPDGRQSGVMIARSKIGLLGDNLQSMTASAVVESVSIDKTSMGACFAVDNHVHHIDLNTLRQVSSKSYPSCVTALSNVDSDGTGPLIVGTTSALHLYDPRDPAGPCLVDEKDTSRCATSAQHRDSITYGATSILNLRGPGAAEHSIWTAGRFKALMVYDRRDMSSPVSSCFSGAQLSSLAVVPYVQPPSDCNLVKSPSLSLSDFYALRSRPGVSILAAGEYHGKGSLEIYGAQWVDGRLQHATSYCNRQTVSSSAALAISPHGASIVISDGNGLLKWFERDGSTPIRTFDIGESTKDPEDDLSLFPARSASAGGKGDVVRKIIQTKTTSSADADSADMFQGRNDLLLWTGDGRIGVLGHGHETSLSADDELDEHGEESRDAELEERMQFERKVGQLLVSQANEARFMSDLGWR